MTKTRLTAKNIEQRLQELAEPERAAIVSGYFKTGPGDYGEGDRFLGLRVPVLRKLSKDYRELTLEEAIHLLRSPYHEARLLALLIMVDQYKRGDAATKKQLFDTYIANTARINSWDLVDLSAGPIVGAHLLDRNRSLLTKLAKSTLLWERRIAIIATFNYIRRGEYDETLRIAELLLHDGEDLIHKAVGWMLREVGQRDRRTEENFLKQHYTEMPRTMLRYAIEKFEPARRRAYLEGAV